MIWTLVLSIFSFQLSSYSMVTSDVVPGEILVRYKSGAFNPKALGKTGMQHGLYLKKTWDAINSAHFKVRGNQGLDQMLDELRKDPNVLFAEPNYRVYAQNLPYPSTDEPIQAPESWASLTTYQRSPPPQPVVVALLDSGLDINHEVFQNTNRLWVNQAESDGEPGVDDDGNGLIDDIHGWNFIDNNHDLTDSSGHGTHVAGIIVGATEDITAVSSATPEAVQVMVLKFLDEDGVGTTSNAVDAIYYAVSKGAKILNNSWGGPSYSISLHEAVAHSFFQNTLFVAAAGNSGVNNDINPIYPANYVVPNVVSVGATLGDEAASYSNYGVSQVDVFAPGTFILSAAVGGGLIQSSGTSMSTPFISGLAAMMLQIAPQFSGYQLRRDVIESVDLLSSLNGLSVAGGRVNFLSALETVNSKKSEPNFNPDYDPEFLSQGSSSLSSNDSSDSGGLGCGRVSSVSEKHNHTPSIFLAVFIFFLPLLLVFLLRQRQR